jgi:hypothetical protein
MTFSDISHNLAASMPTHHDLRDPGEGQTLPMRVTAESCVVEIWTRGAFVVSARRGGMRVTAGGVGMVTARSPSKSGVIRIFQR